MSGTGEAALRAKVLTVSDGVIRGTREDRSGAALAERLTAAGYEVIDRQVVADGVETVAAALGEMADGFAGLIVSTGGTGFAPRDLTPEGTRAVIDREAPGLAEAMRLVSPLGRLSRGIAGVRGRTIVLNTPGSPSGCVEQLDAVLDVLPHALRLLADAPTTHGPHAH
jgi:molybdenum cofactor synthesis domain-containing protein